MDIEDILYALEAEGWNLPLVRYFLLVRPNLDLLDIFTVTLEFEPDLNRMYGVQSIWLSAMRPLCQGHDLLRYSTGVESDVNIKPRHALVLLDSGEYKE